MKNITRQLFCASLFGLLSTVAVAELAVIVNPGNGDTLTKDDISSLYLAKNKSFPNGKNAIPLDRPEGSPLRVEFITKVVGKDEAQMKAYWSRLIFTGKGVPPKIVDSDEEVKEMVARNIDAIGFIDAATADDTVKVIAKF